MDFDQLIKQELHEALAELLAACREQMLSLPVTRFGPVKASGRTAAAMREVVSVTPGGLQGQLLAPLEILTLINGRKPGKQPPPGVILQWLIDKGIAEWLDKNGKAMSRNSQAYLIGRAMARKGNTVFQQGPPSKLFAVILNPNNVAARIKSRITPLLVRNVQSQIHAALTE